VIEREIQTLLWEHPDARSKFIRIETRPRRRSAPPDILRVSEPNRCASGWRRRLGTCKRVRECLDRL